MIRHKNHLNTQYKVELGRGPKGKPKQGMASVRNAVWYSEVCAALDFEWPYLGLNELSRYDREFCCPAAANTKVPSVGWPQFTMDLEKRSGGSPLNIFKAMRARVSI